MAIKLNKKEKSLIEASSISNKEKALEVKNLVISFRTDNGKVQAVRGVSFDLYKGETLCIVGESGSGKSVTSKAIMGILSPNDMIEGGSILYNGIDLTRASETEFQRIRGKKIGMIFQDPLSSLNPIVRIGKQITETMMINKDMLKRYYSDLISPSLTALMNAKSNRDCLIIEAKNKASMPINGYEDKISTFLDRKNELKTQIRQAKKDNKDVTSFESELSKINEEEKAFKEENRQYLEKAKLDAKQVILDAKKQYKEVAPKLKLDLKEAKVKAKEETKKHHEELKSIRDKALSEIASKREKISLSSEDKSLLKELDIEMLKKKALYNLLIGLFYVFPKKHMHFLIKKKEALSPLLARKEEILKDKIALDKEEKKVLDEYQSQVCITKKMAKEKALKVMSEVGIPEPEKRYKQYPFQFSGGMRQRIVIAIALISEPDILICDEPTTALDVTIQAQILELINDLKAKHNMSVIFITHDLGVVANMADRVAVMYAGKICEYGTDKEIFFDPRHPYTWALLASIPDIDSKEKLEAIPGTPPDMIYPPVGDAFALRNKYALGVDFKYEPPFFEVTPTHFVASWLEYEEAPNVTPPKIVSSRIHHALSEEEAKLEYEKD
ncbi:MAG: oligopeptide/dipeptide ABC transporter ATP-binding protein [Candidatus Enteromonas sp.]|nr:oligopeptide/dipeptide ABC transporter ATP-binding protein [Candidatus Enteromonas sp.]